MDSLQLLVEFGLLAEVVEKVVLVLVVAGTTTTKTATRMRILQFVAVAAMMVESSLPALLASLQELQDRKALDFFWRSETRKLVHTRTLSAVVRTIPKAHVEARQICSRTMVPERKK